MEMSISATSYLILIYLILKPGGDAKDKISQDQDDNEKEEYRYL